ncbi:MAG: GNAT family N-acetyltransferase [Flavobacteriales bacterium]|nr:GNAT family N-acetyltransferase [Flavobacteriales bacterium]
MDVLIRKGVKSDLPAVLDLIKELADFERALIEVTVSLEDLEHDGFGNHPYYWFIVAEKEGEIIGLSFYFIRYSTWKGRFLFLEDFVVKESFRNKGVGALLFEETIRIAKELDVKGMTWQVLDWNKNAIRFYEKYNSDISTEWYNGKLTYEQLKQFTL